MERGSRGLEDEPMTSAAVNNTSTEAYQRPQHITYCITFTLLDKMIRTRVLSADTNEVTSVISIFCCRTYQVAFHLASKCNNPVRLMRSDHVCLE